MSKVESAAETLVISAVPMPLILIGRDARIRAINPAAEALFGAQGLGRHYATQLRQPSIALLIDDVLVRGKGGTARFRRPDAGSEENFLVEATPVGKEVLLTFEDVTASEQADQIRRDFVANVSHELKTPLTALLGFIETLRGPAKDDAAARDRFLGVMAREAERMNRLVNDLLSLSRVEAEMRVRPSDDVALVGLVESAQLMLRGAAEAAGVRFEAQIQGTEAELTVPGDADQLMQLLMNLLENAIKYGQSGERVEVILKRVPFVAGLRAEAVQLDVVDYGPGIDPIHIPRLTERFYRVDAHRSREQGGTGLGLAIAKHIVTRHRGRLSILSSGGGGCSILCPLAGDLGVSGHIWV